MAAPRQKLIRIVSALIILVLLTGVGVGYYIWQIGAEARTVYDLGSSLNTFLNDYASTLKRRNLNEVLDKYDASYANSSAGDWTQPTSWDDDSGVKIVFWKETNQRALNRDGVKDQLEVLLGQMRYIDSAKFKIERIEENQQTKSATIQAMLWLRGQEEHGDKVETHTYFRLWLKNQGGWKIVRKDLLDGLTVRGSGEGFAEITDEAGIDFLCSHNPMFAEGPWFPKRFQIVKYAHGGVSTGDYDGDGWDDIFFADGVSSRLYRNRGDATFEDVTAAAGLPDDLGSIAVSLFADLDNDGDPELFMGGASIQSRLYQNNGDGTFEDITASSGIAEINTTFITVASAVDYNNDGALDLYVGRYLDMRDDLPTTLFYARNGAGNILLKNNGSLEFTDATEEAGIREGGLTLGVAWGDYDSDGYLDVYVANDYGRNALFRNKGDGTFEDASVASGVLDIGYGMSSNFADLNNDGALDIYVSNVHSGQRWFGNEATLKNYFVTAYKQGTIHEDQALFDEVKALLGGDVSQLADRIIRGNSMFINRADGTFDDITEESRVNPHGWYWGSYIFDYDNDGLQDVYALNGWITGKEPDDL